MSAPFKAGLDYFPIDVDISIDPRIEYIEAIHGIVGFGIFIKLLEKIYHDGYYMKWEERDLIIFAKKVNVDKNVIINVINDCINEGLFNKRLYEKYKILTSRGIQKRYLRISYRRKRVFLTKEFLLLELKVINALIKDDNVTINSINENINPQIEREIEREIENNIGGADSDKKPVPFEKIISRLNEKAGKDFKSSTGSNKKHIRARWREGYRLEDFFYVIDIKSSQWKGTDREKYLRPETLFGPKFEGYRNEKPRDGPKKKKPDASDLPNHPFINDPLFKVYRQEKEKAVNRFKNSASPEQLGELKEQIYHQVILRNIPDFEEAFSPEEKEKKFAKFCNDYLPEYIAKRINFLPFEQWKIRPP